MAFYFYMTLALAAYVTATAASPASGSGVCQARNGYYKSDDSCDSYVSCKNYRPREQRCPAGLNYNPQAEWPSDPCGHPRDVPCAAQSEARSNNNEEYYNSAQVVQSASHGAYDGASNGAYGSASNGAYDGASNGAYGGASNGAYDGASNVASDGSCPEAYGSFLRSSSASDCGEYLVCVAGRAFNMECPPGLAFDPESKLCNWPDQVPSCDAEDFLGFTCPVPSFDDNGLPTSTMVNYKHGGDCHYFFTCLNGSPRLLSCDEGLAFDSASGQCIDEDLVQC